MTALAAAAEFSCILGSNSASLRSCSSLWELTRRELRLSEPWGLINGFLLLSMEFQLFDR
jgi:hypothetical protein